MIEKTKIKWVTINPYEESTFPNRIREHILIEYIYNSHYNEYLIEFNPTIFTKKEFPDEKGSHIMPPEVFVKGSPGKPDLEIIRWAILEINKED